jgi:hypothetical protein
MDNAYLLILGAAVLAASIVAFRGSRLLAIRAGSAAGITAGSIFVLIGLVNVLSGT